MLRAHLNEASVNVNELQPTVPLGQITKQGVHLGREWMVVIIVSLHSDFSAVMK